MAFAAFLLCVTAAVSADWAPLSPRQGDEGLWRLVFADGRVVTAADCERYGPPKVVQVESSVRTDWVSPDAEVSVTRHPRPDGFDLEMSVRPLSAALTDAALPARLRFESCQIDRLTMPQHGSFGPGLAFNRKFFEHVPHYCYEELYPSAFADYLHLRQCDGRQLAVFGLQPRHGRQPWSATDPFVQTAIGCGRDEKGAWLRHRFVARVQKGELRRFPRLRILKGKSNDAALAAYAEANELTRPLSRKIASDKLAKLVQSPLLYVRNSTCADCRAIVGDLPTPTLFHLTQYLHGGFDKLYPDHLPPNERRFGDGAAFRALIDELHAYGHLFSPYTNPTWWCDSPRGPTFAAAGDAALRLDANRRPIRESYGANVGWSTTLWHPAVRAANAENLRAFVTDYPCDLLFQDQCGNRTGGGCDYNPSSPSPDAYLEGLLSMLTEDSAKVALGTEDGWDQCANLETALFGMCWRTVPCDTIPALHAESLKRRFDPSTWEMSPVALRLMHGKTLFWMHDLGQFVTNERTLAWMLALGYNLSFSVSADEWRFDPVVRNWFRWLAVLQKHVVSKYALRPLTHFEHSRKDVFARKDMDPVLLTDDGVVRARYGDLAVVVNLGDVPRAVEGEKLAPYGFSIRGPGVRAAALQGERPHVMVDGRRCEWTGGDWAKTVDASIPSVRSVALVRLPPEVEPAWTKIMPEQWSEVMRSAAARGAITFREIRSARELAETLSVGPKACGLIINPYGESFPVESADSWQAGLAAVRDYVGHGGFWLETGGYPFSFAVWNEAGTWRRRELGPKGAQVLGLHVVMGELKGAARNLYPTRTGVQTFGAEGASVLAMAEARVNRGLSELPGAPVVPLVRTEAGDVWFGWHPMGKGRFYRVGGTFPPSQVVLPMVRILVEGQPESRKRIVKEN